MLPQRTGLVCADQPGEPQGVAGTRDLRAIQNPTVLVGVPRYLSRVDGTFCPPDAWSMPLSQRAREAGRDLHMTMSNARAARRAVSARLSAYMQAVKDNLPTSTAQFWARTALRSSPKTFDVLPSGK